MKKPKISVIIPTLNREKVLVDSIRQVMAQNFEDFELLVVDQSARHNKSTDNFISKLAKKDKRFRYFSVRPASLTAARNFAVKQARSPYVLFLDDDVKLDSKNFIKHHYDAHQKFYREVAAVAGRVRHKGRKPADKLLYFDIFKKDRASFDHAEPQIADTFPGGNVSLRKDVLELLGGFDTSFVTSAEREESDMAERLKKAGFLIYFEPKASFLHLKAPSGGSRIATHYYDSPDFYKNDLLFTVKNTHPLWLPVVLGAKYYGFTTRHGLKPVPRRTVLFIKGLHSAVKHKRKPKKIVAREISKGPSLNRKKGRSL